MKLIHVAISLRKTLPYFFCYKPPGISILLSPQGPKYESFYEEMEDRKRAVEAKKEKEKARRSLQRDKEREAIREEVARRQEELMEWKKEEQARREEWGHSVSKTGSSFAVLCLC